MWLSPSFYEYRKSLFQCLLRLLLVGYWSEENDRSGDQQCQGIFEKVNNVNSRFYLFCGGQTLDNIQYTRTLWEYQKEKNNCNDYHHKNNFDFKAIYWSLTMLYDILFVCNKAWTLVLTVFNRSCPWSMSSFIEWTKLYCSTLNKKTYWVCSLTSSLIVDAMLFSFVSWSPISINTLSCSLTKN